MIKRILVALDPDSDTPVATRYAIQIARNTDASLTGLAVVDSGSIESSVRGGGIGSMYYAEKLREEMTEESRTRARDLLKTFERTLEGSGIPHVESVEEGVPFRRIVEDMKYHDLLIVGNDPHFFYSHPKKRTDTLAGVIHHTVGPSLIVPDVYCNVKKVLFATDGGSAAARAIRRFIHLAPFGSDLEMHVLHIHGKGSADAELYLALTKTYLEAHGFEPRLSNIVEEDAGKEILRQANAIEADLIISGSQTHKGLRGLRFGETTGHLVEHTSIPLFLDH
ncbi:MAG: universal stress protein [Rhodothermales bacterium]|nr:universal stress protein [Rhodothermales bacterium]